MANGQDSFYDVWNYNPYGLDTSTDYLSSLNRYNTLQRGVNSGISMNDQLRNAMTGLQNELMPVAQWYGTTPDKLTPQQVAQYQEYINQNTGFTGWANNTFGGMGNFVNTLGQLGNLYMNARALGIAKDQLNLQRDSFNFSKAVTTRNFANQVKAYNTALADIRQARAKTQTGNMHAYDDQIEELKLSDKL